MVTEGATLSRMPPVIHNPVLPGSHPDPSIVRVGADFVVATSTFEWSPGVRLHGSRDLRTWTDLGGVLELLQGALQAALADVAPRTDDVRPYLDRHGPVRGVHRHTPSVHAGASESPSTTSPGAAVSGALSACWA